MAVNVELLIDNVDSHYDEDVDLGSSSYRIIIDYITRGDFWNMQILLTDDTPLVSGIRLNANMSYLHRFKDIRLPKGRIIGLSLEDKPLDPTSETLGKTVIIIYEED